MDRGRGSKVLPFETAPDESALLMSPAATSGAEMLVVGGGPAGSTAALLLAEQNSGGGDFKLRLDTAHRGCRWKELSSGGPGGSARLLHLSGHRRAAPSASPGSAPGSGRSPAVEGGVCRPGARGDGSMV